MNFWCLYLNKSKYKFKLYGTGSKLVNYQINYKFEQRSTGSADHLCASGLSDAQTSNFYVFYYKRHVYLFSLHAYVSFSP